MRVPSFQVFPSTKHNSPIIAFQSPHTRALNLGFVKQKKFVPARLLFGSKRCMFTHDATLETLLLPPVKKILKKYQPAKISTVTVLRETLSCRISDALFKTGMNGHYGDAFIGATHIKDNGPIRTAYLYENVEGLIPDGLWIIGESFCTGRNLYATMTSLLKKFQPAEILFIAPLASRRAIEYIDSVIAPHQIPTTYVAWGGLFGVDEKTLYDMPWGHKDTEPVDVRDQKLFIKIYNETLCVGGDFGNNYYSPPKALEFYKWQLKDQKIKPRFPSYEMLLKIYKKSELVII